MEICIRCGLPENHPNHDSRNPPKDTGWHPFRSQTYLDALEDALLFVREKEQLHQWKETGFIIDTIPEFAEKVCTVCGGVNWGGKEDGICFGNHDAELAVNAARNRRAMRK